MTRSYDWIAHHAATRPDATAMIDIATDRSLTETSPVVLGLEPEDCGGKVGSAGLPAMHTEGRIVGEDGNDVTPGETESCASGDPTSLPATGTAPTPWPSGSPTLGSTAATIGVPDEKWVEVGRACVVANNGAELDEATIINHCRQNRARNTVPQSVVFIDEIPHNATGNVLERELRRFYGDAS